jgi:hypothetical protein
MPEQTHDERYLKALCDPDAGVMISALPIYLKLCKVGEKPVKLSSLTCIMNIKDAG